MPKTEAVSKRVLKDGKRLVDAFYRWLVDEEKLGRKTADRHAFNAERLIDYLANYPRKSAGEMNELDFREFFFDHSIRKLIGGEDAKMALPESLSLFFGFLVHDGAAKDLSWALRIITEEKQRYLRRLNEYESLDPDDQRWDDEYLAWCEEYTDDLYNRCLVPSSKLLNGECWGDCMGLKEFELYEELTAHLLEHSAKIDPDNTMPLPEKRRLLDEEQRRWLAAERRDLNGKTPFEVIMEEREEIGIAEEAER